MKVRDIIKEILLTIYNSCSPLAIERGESVSLKVGDEAPDFELPAVVGAERQPFKLSSLRGKKNVVLAFYALDWSPT